MRQTPHVPATLSSPESSGFVRSTLLKAGALVGAMTAGTWIGIHGMMNSAGHVQQKKPGVSQREPEHETKPAEKHEEKTETVPQGDGHQDVTAKEAPAPMLTKEQCIEEACKYWVHATSAKTVEGIEKALADMDRMLKAAGCSRETIHATPDGIREAYKNLAKEEWERAKYFHDLRFFTFFYGALDDMEAALKKGGLTLADIGVMEDEVKKLKDDAKEAAKDPGMKDEGK